LYDTSFRSHIIFKDYLVMHQIFDISKSIIVLGHPPTTFSLSGVLKILDITCHFHQPDFYESTKFSTSMILVLGKPYQVIEQIHKFRGVEWQGTFITVVNKSIEKEQLLNHSLFGEKDGKLAYGQIPGHKVALTHSLLSDILFFQNDPGLSSGAWRDYLAKSSINALLQQLQQTSIDIQKVLTTIHSLNILWDTIISHEQARYIRELKQKYPLGTTPPPSEVSQIITNLQTRLAHI
jgi:hypothetical protein